MNGFPYIPSSPFFSSEQRIATLVEEAKQWVGTPFVKGAMIRGAGADCIHLIAGIYRASGFLGVFKPGPYALDEGQHLTRSKVLAWFEERKDFDQISTNRVDLRPGDTLCFNLARVGHHTGLMLTNGDFIHTWQTRKALIANLRESLYSGCITAVYRPLEVHS